MFEEWNKPKSIKPFLQWKGFLRARTWEQRCWCFSLTASQIQLGNERNKWVASSNSLPAAHGSYLRRLVASSPAAAAGPSGAGLGSAALGRPPSPCLPQGVWRQTPKLLLWKEIFPHQIHLTNVCLEHYIYCPEACIPGYFTWTTVEVTWIVSKETTLLN